MHKPVVTSIVLAASALMAASAAWAQGGTTDVQLAFEKASVLSGAQQIDRAEELLKRMRDQLRRGFQLLEQARGEKDIVKLNAINETLSSMKGLFKVSEGAFVALQEAAARKDKETADHEFTKIAIAAQKIDGLALDAEGVVGDTLHRSGQTRVEVSAEGMAAEGDVPTAGAGADVPTGAGSGAAGAAAGIAGGADTQDTLPDGEGGDEQEGRPGTIDDPATGDASSGGEFDLVQPTDVVQPVASPVL
jgi:hypothetical protein